ncbi:hypothetical protein [Yersinia proxima]|uniref:hypothetical protein n=1 Tax=Yersinia proxima TaxID=2890316 RepID=UPI003D69BC89
MNNIDEMINHIKSEIASDNLCVRDELTITVSDLSALIAQLEAAQRDRNMHYQVSEKFRIELIAAEAELSAANEKLGKPVVLSSSTVMSRVCAVRAIKAAGFTVEGD